MPCQHCGARAQLYLCAPCTQQLRSMLLQLVTGPEHDGHSSAGLLEDLRDAATGHTRFTDPGPHTGRPESTAPRLNPAASDLLARIGTQLADIAACIAPYGPNGHPGYTTSQTPEKVALWLAQNVKTIAAHIDADQTFCRIHATIHRIQAIIDRPEPTQPAGHCDCGTTLRARASATEITCPNCGIILNIDQRQRQLLRELITAGRGFTRDEFPVALSMLGVAYSARSFRRHRASNTLPIAGYTDTGEPLYRPLDLSKLKAAIP